MKLLSVFFTFFLHLYCSAQSIIILVHGTWALQEQWCKPGGNFFETLKRHIPIDAKVVSFNWCGSNNHGKRIAAAKQLVTLIESYPQTTSIILITHSHGGNVGILASQILSANKKNYNKIKQFFSLATPVDAESYAPNMNVIHYFYHLFSFEDLVQPVLGMFERQYPTHERCANMCVTINNKEPGHSSMHHPVVARWLLQVHKLLLRQTARVRKEGIVHFEQNKIPTFEIDYKRQEKIEQDLELQKLILLSFRKGNKDYLQ